MKIAIYMLKYGTAMGVAMIYVGMGSLWYIGWDLSETVLEKVSAGLVGAMVFTVLTGVLLLFVFGEKEPDRAPRFFPQPPPAPAGKPKQAEWKPQSRSSGNILKPPRS